jgi:hypothetical protein
VGFRLIKEGRSRERRKGKRKGRRREKKRKRREINPKKKPGNTYPYIGVSKTQENRL